VVSDGNGIPLAAHLTAASEHELRHALFVMDQIRVSTGRPGRPKQRPKTLAADKGYDSRKFRRELRERNIQPIIPARQWKGRKKRVGRQPGSFVKDHPKHRWRIERTHAWFDNYRRLAMRYERKHQNFEALLALGAAMICLSKILR